MFARLVNVIAFRTYALLATGFAVFYLAASGFAFYWMQFGVPAQLFGHSLRDNPLFSDVMLPKFAWGLLAFGLIYALLSILTWRRSVTAVIICFLLWAFVAAQAVLHGPGGLSTHALELSGVIALALLMAGAIATRRRAAVAQ